MDFKIGGTTRIGSPADKKAGPTNHIEAKVLAIRAPRKRTTAVQSQPERRKNPQQRDPSGGRILVLMIPDGHQLPDGIERGSYRVFLRFAKR